MGFWRKLLAGARLGAMIAGRVKIKGVPIRDIAEEAEKEGAHVVDSVKRLKVVAKKPPSKPGA